MHLQTPVTIPGHCKQAMLHHALQDLPNECCGVLLGRGGKIERLVTMRSTEPSPDAYFMDPEQQAALFTVMEQQGEALLGIYHSHPRGPATPSGADLQLAFHPGVVYIIICLADRNNPEIRGFMLEEQRFTEVPVAFI
jgi:proteasome lid subunit RPN8/RPN11